MIRPLDKLYPRILLGLALSSAFAGMATCDTFTGPVSKYYLAGIDTIYVVQGSSVVETIPEVYGKGDYEGVIAVSQTIRTRASRFEFTPSSAGEYTLSGVPTGRSYPSPSVTSPLSWVRIYDGTTDGVNNYYLDHWYGGVYSTDYYWENPQLLFYDAASDRCHPCYGQTGIAYDPIRHSLWISELGDIEEYSLDGTLLAQFGTSDDVMGLGMDPADDTLWATSFWYPNVLRQYSLDPATFGALLQEGVPAGLPGGLYSAGEFQITPEPSSIMLLVSPLAISLALRILRFTKR